MCLCMALIGTMFVTTTVNAAEPTTWYFDERDTYTQTISDVKYNYTKDQKKELLRQCEVKNPDMYLDDFIKKQARQGLEYENKLYDLRFLAEFGLFSIKTGKNKAFNYGFIETDNLLNPSYIRVHCKCSNKDFKDFMSYNGNAVTKDNYADETIKVDGRKWIINYRISSSPDTNDIVIRIDY